MLSRRKFISNSAMSFVGLPLLAATHNDIQIESKKSYLNSKSSLFVSESGTLYDQSSFFIGAIRVDRKDVDDISEELLAIRNNNNYRSIIKYSGNDRFKLGCAKEWLDLFMDDDRLLFKGMVVDLSTASDYLNYRDFPPHKKMDKKSTLYRLLMDRFDDVKEIFVKSQSTYGPSRKFKNKFKNSNNSVDYDDLDTMDSDIIQLADLISGCSMASLSAMPRNLIKLELIDYFLDKLSLDTVTQNTQITNKYIIESI